VRTLGTRACQELEVVFGKATCWFCAFWNSQTKKREDMYTRYTNMK